MNVFIFFLLTLTFAHWRQFPNTLNPPQRRYSLQGATSQQNGYFLITMGRADGSVIYDDTWKFDMIKKKWYFMALTSEINPQPRYYGSTEFHENEQTMILFGGNTEYGPRNDLWKFQIKSQS